MPTNNQKPTSVLQQRARQLENVGPALQLLNQFLPWIVTMIFLTVFLLAYFLVLGPKFTEVIDQQQSFLPERRSTLETMEKIETRLKDLDRKFSQLKITRQSDLDFLKKALPDQPDYPGLFAQAEYLAKLHNFELQSVDITESSERPLENRQEPSAEQAQSASEIALGSLPKDVYLLTVNIQLGSGTYNQFKAYLESLEKNLRLYNIQSINFSGLNAEDETISSFNIVLVTYYRSPLLTAIKDTIAEEVQNQNKTNQSGPGSNE